MPDNWLGLTSPQVFAVVELMSDTGWSLVWTPPAETISRVLDAPDPESRRSILLAAEGRILFDLEALLGRVDDSTLLASLEAVKESLETYRSGYYKASQALTAGILSTLLHEHSLERRLQKIREKFLKADQREASLREFRWIALQLAVAKTLDNYDPVKGEPERPEFNRHASAHSVKEPQYQQVNALSGLMLVVSMMVELNDPPDDGL